MYGNGGTKALSKLALELEQFRAVVLSALPGAHVDVEERITIFAFKDRDTLARYPLSNMGPGMVTGLFVRLDQLDDAWAVYEQAVRGIEPLDSQAGARGVPEAAERARRVASTTAGRHDEVQARCRELDHRGLLAPEMQSLQSVFGPVPGQGGADASSP